MPKELEAIDQELKLLKQQKNNLLHKQAKAKTDNETKYWQWRIDKFNEKIELMNFAKSSLERLEAIDNSKPSEALKKFDYIGNDIKFAYDDDYVSYDYTDDVEYIKQTLIKSQEMEKELDNLKYKNKLLTKENVRNAKIAEKQHKMIEIIKEKNVDINYLRYEAVNVRMYNNYISQLNKVSTINHSSLDDEEFNLLKEF